MAYDDTATSMNHNEMRVTDDLEKLLAILPVPLQERLHAHERLDELVEVVLIQDGGRRRAFAKAATISPRSRSPRTNWTGAPPGWANFPATTARASSGPSTASVRCATATAKLSV